MSWSISRRLVLWLAVPLILLSLMWDLTNYFFNVAPVIRESELRLRAVAHTLVEHIEIANGQIRLSDVAAVDDRVRRNNVILYAIRGPANMLISGDARLQAASLSEQQKESHSITNLDGREFRLLTVGANTSVGVATVTVAEPIAKGQFGTRLSFIGTLLLDFVRLDITLVLMWFAVRIGMRPLNELREEIESRSISNLRPLLESSAPKEIAPLVTTINKLIVRLGESLHAQQQFLANTAHQLRTPITGIAVQLDLLMDDSAAAPIKDRIAALQSSIRELSHSTNQLLTLARAETALNHRARNTSVALDALAKDVAMKFVDRALAAGIDLGVNTEPVRMTADIALLDDMLSNLVDNAVKYTPPGGRVTIGAGIDNGRPFLDVDDDGRGIPQQERQHVLTRFYRSPDSPGYGSGLGLAIVDEIAHIHGASLVIETGSAGKGTRIRVRFPLVNPS